MKTSSILDTYQTWLTHREYSPATIQKYTKALARFFADTGAGDIPTRETVAAWRDSLTEKGYTPATVNAMLAAVNDCQESIDNVAGKAKPLKHQRRIFADPGRELTRAEYFRLLNAAHIDDVPVLHGCTAPLASPEDAPDCEAVEFLIQEALRDDPAPLYIAAQGAMTNIAAALNRAPEIASRMTVLWNGGGPYPAGRPEFNVQQDPIACRVLLDSAVTVWQIPQDVYARFEVSLSELALRVRPCGEVGAYLFQQLMDEYPSEYDPRFPLRTGGNWTLGDNTTAAVLLENGFRGHWTLRPAPVLLPNLTYAETSDRKTIRVYHDLDVRFALEDFYSKLALCYPR